MSSLTREDVIEQMLTEYELVSSTWDAHAETVGITIHVKEV